MTIDDQNPSGGGTQAALWLGYGLNMATTPGTRIDGLPSMLDWTSSIVPAPSHYQTLTVIGLTSVNPLPIPNLPSLIGIELCFQAMLGSVDPSYPFTWSELMTVVIY